MKADCRYESNKRARTIQQAVSFGATNGDLAWDFKKGFITLLGRPDSAPPDRVANNNCEFLVPETPAPRRAKPKQDCAAQIKHKAYRLIKKTSPAALDKLVAAQGSPSLAQPQGDQAHAQAPQGPTTSKAKRVPPLPEFIRDPVCPPPAAAGTTSLCICSSWRRTSANSSPTNTSRSASVCVVASKVSFCHYSGFDDTQSKAISSQGFQSKNVIYYKKVLT